LNELRLYNPELLVKDRVLAVTKCDLINERKISKIEPTLPKDIPHVFISAVKNEGLKELEDKLWIALNK
jgi:GTP-binding protein